MIIPCRSYTRKDQGQPAVLLHIIIKTFCLQIHIALPNATSYTNVITSKVIPPIFKIVYVVEIEHIPRKTVFINKDA